VAAPDPGDVAVARRPAIVLIGMMGSGKSAVGRRLADRLGCELVDIDHEVEAAAGRPVADIFAVEGELGFRAREAAAVQAVTQRGPGVIAGGGGVVLDPTNVAALREAGTVVWLQVDPALAARRVRDDGGRPVLARMEGTLEERLAVLTAERSAAYAAAAHHVVDAAGAPDDVAQAVLALVGGLRSGR
jgi:shikimate kinase